MLQQLDVLARGTPDEILLEQLHAREPTDVDGLVRRAGLPARRGARGAGAADRRARPRWCSINGHLARSLVRRLEHRLASADRSASKRCWAPSIGAIRCAAACPRRSCARGLGADPRLFVRVLERLETQGTAAEEGPSCGSRATRCSSRPTRSARPQQVIDVLREAGVAPPERADLEATLRVSPELTDALHRPGRAGRSHARACSTIAQTLETSSPIRADITQNGPRTVAQIRDLLDASRKYVLALVGYTDEHKITRRVGDERVLY